MNIKLKAQDLYKMDFTTSINYTNENENKKKKSIQSMDLNRKLDIEELE